MEKEELKRKKHFYVTYSYEDYKNKKDLRTNAGGWNTFCIKYRASYSSNEEIVFPGGGGYGYGDATPEFDTADEVKKYCEDNGIKIGGKFKRTVGYGDKEKQTELEFTISEIRIEKLVKCTDSGSCATIELNQDKYNDMSLYNKSPKVDIESAMKYRDEHPIKEHIEYTESDVDQSLIYDMWFQFCAECKKINKDVFDKMYKNIFSKIDIEKFCK